MSRSLTMFCYIVAACLRQVSVNCVDGSKVVFKQIDAEELKRFAAGGSSDITQKSYDVCYKKNTLGNFGFQGGLELLS